MKNEKLAYVLTVLSELYWPSVPALFFYLRYFSFAQIATLWAIQMAAGIIFEVPTGAIADTIGRRKSIVISYIIGAVSLFVFPFTTAFPVFAALEVLKGLSNAFYSGSLEALIYDDLKEQQKEDEYTQVSANIESINWTAWAISSVGGGYLYYWRFQSPWLIQAVMFVVGVVVAWNLVEPKIDSIKINWKAAIKQNTQGFHELFANNRTARITMQLAVIGAGYIIASNILGASQAREYGMDARGTGWIFAIGCLLSVVAARYYPKLRAKLGEKRLVVVSSLMMLASFLLARWVGLGMGIGLILLRIASSSTFRNTRSIIVNKWITSRNRATALSSLSLLTQAPYVLAAPLLGLVIDKSSPNMFAWYLGLIVVILVGSIHLIQPLWRVRE